MVQPGTLVYGAFAVITQSIGQQKTKKKTKHMQYISANHVFFPCFIPLQTLVQKNTC